MSLEFLLTKGLNASLVLLFFALIVLLLRFLYGPKGIFRDPHWDACNEQARLDLEKWVDARNDEDYKKAFIRYAQEFYSGNDDQDLPLRLKLEHSLEVLAIAKEIAASEPAFADHETGRALRLAALFHDAGRFEQYERYCTFADASSCNHGLLGVRVMRQQNFLRNEPKRMRQTVMAAIAAHNKLLLPKGLSGQKLSVLQALRDADKLDILRVLAQNLEPGNEDATVLLHLEDAPESWSEPVFAALKEGRVALYKDMRFYNDFRLLLCTWLFDLHFPTSYLIADRQGHYGRILQGLSCAPEVQAAARQVVDEDLGGKAPLAGLVAEPQV